MSKVIEKILDNCISNFNNDENFKFKIENEILNPFMQKGYKKLKPYVHIIFYLYGILIVLLLIIIILIIKKK